MKTKTKNTGKAILTVALVLICIGALPLLCVGDSPPFLTAPEHYFLKALIIKLLGMLIIGACAGCIISMWNKAKQLM